MAKPVDTILAGSIWGNFGQIAVVEESLTTQAEDRRMSINRVISDTRAAVEMALFGESDPKMTPLAEKTPNSGSGVDVTL